MEETYIVICRDDRRSEEDPPGEYVLATRDVFESRDAANRYASGIATGREAIVVAGRWSQLRFGTSHQ